MTKRVPIRIRTQAKPEHHFMQMAWRVTGDQYSDRTLHWRWGFFRHSPIQSVINSAILGKRSLEISSGKKDKKFWRKVHRHIDKHYVEPIYD